MKDAHGAIIRGDVSKPEIALVFTGDEFADGGSTILETLGKYRVKGSFFLTGNFYSNPKFRPLLRSLRKKRHYLGAHSDKHLLYADWVKRDSLLVTEDEFKHDMQENYKKMSEFGVRPQDAPWFIPPYEWYNGQVVNWSAEMGLQLINFSPGTRSTADYTYPGMGKSYRSSAEIYESIIRCAQTDPNGLNGFILLVHIGTDPRRTDKFYDKLDQLLTELKSMNYSFVSIKELLE